MSGLNTFQLVAAGVHFIPALVWAIIAQHGWRHTRSRPDTGRFHQMLPLVSGSVAFTYCTLTLICFIPDELRQDRPGAVMLLSVLNDWSLYAVLALARHMSRYFPSPEKTPGWRWLAVNYGSSAVMALLAPCFIGLIDVPAAAGRMGFYNVIRLLYQLIMIGSIVLSMVPTMRPGNWRSTGGAWLGTRRADVLFLAGGLLSLGCWFLVLLTTESSTLWVPSSLNVALDGIAGVGFAAPLALRILGAVVRGVLMFVLMFVGTAGVYLGAEHLRAAAAPTGLRPLVDVASLLAFVLLLGPGSSWLRAAIDRLLFRRSRQRHQGLQSCLHTLSPELGPLECCRRVVPDVAQILRLRGAAIILHDGEVAEHGQIVFGSAERLWATADMLEALPPHPLVGYELRELPVRARQVLNETDIVGVVPIISRQRRWGVLLISTGLLGATFSEEDAEALGAFADQLALVFDGSALLARALEVERSLAHAGKLAAIGALAARVAHEIRNPVTAARSLAQQLVRDPASPFNTEHAGLILDELERVERQVQALLRFARREEFSFEAVDLGELVSATVEHFRPRLEAAGIELEAEIRRDLIVHADREKLRQVLINLIDNAVDALGQAADGGRLAVSVVAHNATAQVRVADNGPGVAPDALPHLFEPFFSSKATGTGLGLAIAKRTVDAHGGRIEAACPTGAGATFRIDLPLAAGA